MIDLKAMTNGFIEWLSGPYFRNPYSKATIKTYSRNVRYFLEFLDFEGAESIQECNVHLVRKYIMAMRGGGTAPINTQNVRAGALSMFFDYLESTAEHGEYSGNPARSLMEEQKHKKGGRAGRSATRLNPVLEWEEIDRLHFTASKLETIAGMRDAALVGFMLDTGLRASEVCALQLSDLDGYYQGRMRVIGKGDKERLIRFQTNHAARLQSWIRTRSRLQAQNDALFVTDHGTPLTAQVLYMIIHRLLERARIKKAQSGPHLLRHTAASMWLAKGMDLRQVQENMGHSNIATTSNYLHLLG